MLERRRRWELPAAGWHLDDAGAGAVVKDESAAAADRFRYEEVKFDAISQRKAERLYGHLNVQRAEEGRELRTRLQVGTGWHPSIGARQQRNDHSIRRRVEPQHLEWVGGIAWADVQRPQHLAAEQEAPGEPLRLLHLGDLADGGQEVLRARIALEDLIVLRGRDGIALKVSPALLTDSKNARLRRAFEEEEYRARARRAGIKSR